MFEQINSAYLTGVLLTAVLSTQSAVAQTKSSEGLPVEAVINAVRDALREAQANNIPGFPPLKEVNLKLKTVVVKEAGVTIKFLIFSIGAKKTKEAVSEIVFAMRPPATKNTIELHSVNETKLKLAFAQAIHSAKAGILIGDQGEPKLELQDLTITVQFGVKQSGSGGVDTADLLPIGLKGTGDLSANQIHTVELKFGG